MLTVWSLCSVILDYSCLFWI